MNYVGIYSILSLTTGVVGWLSLARPYIKEAIREKVENPITYSPRMASVVFISVFAITAPLVLFFMFSTKKNYESTCEAMRKVIFEPEEKI